MEFEVSSRVVMNVPRAEAWQKLRDYSLAHHYVPGLVKTEITTEHREGVGASRKVYQSETRYIDETITDWEEGRGYTLRLHRGDNGAPFPFEEAAFRYHLDDAGNEMTALTTTLMFSMRFGAIGRLLKNRLLSPVFKSTIRDVAISQKDFYETGVPVTPQRLKVLRKQSR